MVIIVDYNIDFPVDEKYTVIGVEAGKNRIYHIKCSVCSKDKELFPNHFKSARPSFKRGNVCCGCSKNYKYNSEQLKVLLKRKAEELKVSINLLGDSLEKESPIIFYCCDKSEGKETTVRRFLHKTSCYCSHKDEHWRTGQTKKHLEEVYKGQYDNFKFNKITGLWDFECSTCKYDEFVMAGLCSGVFSASSSRLSKTKIPVCRCATAPILTPDQNLYRCVKTSGEGYEVTGYEEPYKGVYTLIGFVCPKGNKNIATVMSFLTGRRCTCCTDSGFNKSKDGSLYVVKWEHISGINFLKYGITNRDIEERIKEQYREASEGFSYEILKVFRGSGEDVSGIERKIREEVGGRYASPYLFPDGWTETCSTNKASTIFSLIDLF